MDPTSQVPGIEFAPSSGLGLGLDASQVPLCGILPEEMARFSGLGRRLASEIRAVIGDLPVEVRSVRAMATYLGVNRNLCQRAIAAAGSTKGGLDVLAKAPSWAQLIVLADALGRKHIEASAVEALRAAIHEVADLSVSVSGNEARFRAELRAALLGASRSSEFSGSDAGARKSLFEQASRVAGSSTELRLGVGVMWPSSASLATIDLSMVAAYRSYTCRKGGLPLTAFFHESRDSSSPSSQSTTPYEHVPQQPRRALLDPFCSSPLPFVTPHGPKDLEHHVVDTSACEDNHPIDVATLHQTRGVPHPALRTEDPFIDVLLHLAIPTRRLVFDFYLHRSLARQSIPFFGVFALGYGIELSMRNAWYRQLPEGGSLELLGEGIKNPANHAWDRHGELLSLTFDQLGLNPADTIGYRADIAYPVWGMTYAIGFDFAGTPSGD